METKTFEALTMKDAIKAVKKEFGPDAVILRTKEKTSAENPQSRVFEVTASAPITKSSRPQQRESQHLATLGGDLGELNQKISTITESLPSKANFQTIEAGLKELKLILMESLDSNSAKDTRLPAEVRAIKNQLKVMNISDGNITNVIKFLKEKRAEAVKKGVDKDSIDADFYKAHAIRYMLKNIRISPQWNVIPGGLAIHAFVGTSGTGKTSSIIKVATHYKTKLNSNVLLVSYDNTKLGGSEQLRIYSNIIDCKYEQIASPAELENVLMKHRDADLVLVDCSGQNAKSSDLDSDIVALNQLTVPIDFHLVCSATEKEVQSDQAVRHFSPLSLQSLIFTRIDESWSFGEIYNTSLKWGVPLSYFSTGQSIPEDIERASRERVVEQIFGL